jgi:hypothetical protein
MVESDKREQYQTRYSAVKETENNITPGDVLLVDNYQAEGQITSIKVYAPTRTDVSVYTIPIANGEDAVPFDPTVSAVGGASNTPRLHLVGENKYKVGDFEDPAVEAGARTQVRVVVEQTPGTDEPVGISVRSDEHLG